MNTRKNKKKSGTKKSGARKNKKIGSARVAKEKAERVVVVTWMSPAERSHLKKVAGKSGISMGAVIRALIGAKNA